MCAVTSRGWHITPTTDSIGYSGVDSGCDKATKHLGRPSRCLECPFAECKETNDPVQAKTDRKSVKQREYQALWQKANRERCNAYQRTHRTRMKLKKEARA